MNNSYEKKICYCCKQETIILSGNTCNDCIELLKQFHELRASKRYQRITILIPEKDNEISSEKQDTVISLEKQDTVISPENPANENSNNNVNSQFRNRYIIFSIIGFITIAGFYYLQKK